MVLGLEHSHQTEGHAGEEDGGEHHSGQRNGQSRGLGVGVVGEEGHEGSGEYHPRQSEGPGEQSDHREKAACEAQGLLFPLFFQILAEHRNKAGGNGGGEHRVEKYPGNSAGREKGVGRRTRAVVNGQQPVPVEAQYLADERDRHHKADSPGRAVVPLLQSVHLL